jgi:DNA-binding transcriptional MerR regulator
MEADATSLRFDLIMRRYRRTKERLTMTIAEVSKQYGLSIDTLRYYEKIGLIAPVSRTKGGIRSYGESDCLAVDFIKCMRGAGITVEALVEYMSLFQKGQKTREARKKILKEQRDQLKVRITEMQDALEKLNFKIDNYDTLMVEVENKFIDKENYKEI